MELPPQIVVYKSIRRFRLYFFYRHRRKNPGKTYLDIDKAFFLSFRTISKCFFDNCLKEELVTELEAMGLKDEILNDADCISDHIFNLLGSGDVRLPRKIPWNQDFKSGFIWENGFYKDVKTIDINNNADVKVPWELSRFQHVFTLGKAYWLSNDEKYAEEFKAQVEDWIYSNPIENSVNWTCTMEVAIRAVNLIIGYYLFCNSTIIDNDFWSDFNKLLYLHGRFILKNLEDSEQYKNNHYLSDIIGLVWLGIYFKDFEVGDRYSKNGSKLWLKYGLDRLKKECDIQINEDGTDYEAATAYHRLVAEMLMYTTILCEKNSIYFDDAYMNKLRKMCIFIMDILKPNELCPLIGDMDDGRFIITSRYYSWERRDFRHILAVAGELFSDNQFRSYGTDFEEDALFCRRKIRIKSKNSHMEAKTYKNGGYYIFRNKSIYMIVRCGELSCRGMGNHSHNDQLSFEFNYENEDFIIDPGVYTYTSDYQMKKLFRSTRVHNTLCVHNYEQNDFNDFEIFDLKEQTFAKCTNMNDVYFEGMHFGYMGKCGIIHKRKICIDHDEINIYDSIIYTSKGRKERHETCNVFSLDKDVKAQVEDNCVRLFKNGKQLLLSFENEAIRLEEGFVSYSYGKIEKSTRIVVENGYNQEIRTCIKYL